LVEFKTGEIMDCHDERSGQLDIVLQSIAAPRIPLFDNIQITMAEAALGVIEVKSNLTTASWEKSSHLRSALRTFRKVKSLDRNGSRIFIPSAYGSNRFSKEHPNTPCFLVAYKGPLKETLMEKLIGYGQHFDLPTDEYAPDVTCVLNPGYYIYRDDELLFPKGDQEFYARVGDDSLAGIFMYACQIIEAWNGTTHLTRLVDYFAPLRGGASQVATRSATF
jgi:hypothetical protein